MTTTPSIDHQKPFCRLSHGFRDGWFHHCELFWFPVTEWMYDVGYDVLCQVFGTRAPATQVFVSRVATLTFEEVQVP